MAKLIKSDSNLTWPSLIWRIVSNNKILLISVILSGLAAYIYFKINDKSHVLTSHGCRYWTLTGRLISKEFKYINSTGLKVGMYSGPFTSDDKIIEGVFRITSVELSEDKFIQLYIESNNSQMLFFKGPLDENKQLIDTNRCTITFKEDIIIDFDRFKSLVNDAHTPISRKQLKKRKLLFINLKEFNDTKVKLKGADFDISADHPDFKIEFTYSNKIENIGKIYSGIPGDTFC